MKNNEEKLYLDNDGYHLSFAVSHFLNINLALIL